MSSAARAARRRAERATAKGVADDDHVGVTMAVAGTPADVEEAQRASHDGLIALMGTRRRGGVSWRHYTGEAALRVVTEVGTVGGVWDARYDGYLRALADWPDAVLVVATARVAP